MFLSPHRKYTLGSNPWLSRLAIIALLWHTSAISATPKNLAQTAMSNGTYQQALEIALPLATTGHAWAELIISQLYDQGLGLEKDTQQALTWLEKAAQHGSDDAMLILAMKYLEFNGEKNNAYTDKANQLLNSIAKHNPKLRQQLFYAAKAMYIRSEYTQAFILADAAAKYGNSDAQFLIGVMFDKGQGVPTYQTEAIEWYTKAAEQGHAMAQLYLAIKYDRGDGTTQHSKKAAYWYQKAAEQNITQAMLRLGELYGAGLGIQQNHALSIEWLKKATQQNSPQAMQALAKKYVKGDGVKQSRYNAVDWYYRAGSAFFQQGNKEQALGSIEAIEQLVPNHFLSKRLLNEIYSPAIETNTSHDVNAQHGEIAYGTAWPISETYIITAYHVLEGREKIHLLDTQGHKFNAKLALFDHANDLAILKVKGSSHTLQPLNLSQQALQLGDDVFTIGYPEPDLLGKRAKYTTGKINSLFGFRDDPRFLQTSTPILSGNSGGPLFNKNGEVSGIIISQLNAMKMFETTGDIPQNVNYAIKLPYLNALIAMLPEKVNIKTNQHSSSTDSQKITELTQSVLTVIAE